MSKYSINDTTLAAIGNAIKTKEGSSEAIAVSDFANRIVNLPSGGAETRTDSIIYFQNNMPMVKTILKDYYNGDLDKIVSFIYIATNSFSSSTKDFDSPRYIYIYNKDICPIYRNQPIKASKYDSTIFYGDVLACDTFVYNPSYSYYHLCAPNPSTPQANSFGLTYNSVNKCLNILYWAGSGTSWANNDRYTDMYDVSGHIYITQEV